MLYHVVYVQSIKSAYAHDTLVIHHWFILIHYHINNILKQHINNILTTYDWQSLTNIFTHIFTIPPGLSALATWDGHLPGVRIELPPRRGQPPGGFIWVVPLGHLSHMWTKMLFTGNWYINSLQLMNWWKIDGELNIIDAFLWFQKLFQTRLKFWNVFLWVLI